MSMSVSESNSMSVSNSNSMSMSKSEYVMHLTNDNTYDNTYLGAGDVVAVVGVKLGAAVVVGVDELVRQRIGDTPAVHIILAHRDL